MTPVNPAFSVNKSVQGNLDAAPSGAAASANVSPTGGTATYDVTFTNTGQANLTDPVMYDILPAVGDTYATSLAARGSQFTVALTGVGPLPAGVTVYYSTSTNPCRPEVLPSDPGCVNDWSTTPPAPLSSVTALEFVYTGTIVVAGGSGTNSFSIPFSVSTPTTTPGQVAWNTVGTDAYAGGSLIAPAESSRTGLQAEAQPTIVKASSTASYSTPGDTISYTYTVTNGTAVTLSAVGVTDNPVAPAGPLTTGPSCQSLSAPAGACSGATTTLAPGQSALFTATYTVTQADIDHGSVTDTATVNADPPTGGALTNTSNPVSVPAAQSDSLGIAKSLAAGSPDPVTAAAQVLTYQFAVTNTGDTTETAVGVTDTQTPPAGPLTTPPACQSLSSPAGVCSGATTSLAPGQTALFTATYTVTQTDVDRGSIADSATATGTSPGGPVTSPPSPLTVPVAQTNTLSIVKSLAAGSPYPITTPGQVLTYQFAVTNTGNTTENSVGVTDTQTPPAGPLTTAPACQSLSSPAGACSGATTTLAPGQTATFTATYTVAQADIDQGSIGDSAIASGIPPGSTTPVSSPPATFTVAVDPDRQRRPGQDGDLQRAADHSRPGGHLRLRGDQHRHRHPDRHHRGRHPSPPAGPLTSGPTCPEPTLAPGDSETCTGSYTVTQADIHQGTVNDTATASGTTPRPRTCRRPLTPPPPPRRRRPSPW